MTIEAPDDGFDFIIVGGGSAGCVLANRLSEDPSTTVCLIEAGSDARSALIDIPIGIMALINHERFNWRSRSVPQPAAAGREIYIPRGKVVGGGSAINGMVYMRGDAHDYDDWARAGATGWSYAEVLPHFLRAEDNAAWRDSPYHGVGGPLGVAEMRSINLAANAFVKAAQLLQIPRTPDFSMPHPLGVGYRQVTQRGGRRESAATAYLAPARKRPNLAIWADGVVDRVLLDGKRATGVRLHRDGEWRMIAAHREVVLSAGAIGSPSILERSGIGDPVRLREAGIAPLHALPGVGANLQDHATASVAHRTRSRVPYGLSLGGIPRLAWHGAAWLAARRGLLSSNASEAAAFVRLDPAADRADLQLSFVSGRRGTNIRAGDWGHGYGVTAIQLHPRGRGSVHVRSADPDAPPAVDFAALADSADLAVLVDGLKLARRILAAPPFARFGGREVAPGPDIGGDEALADYVRRTSGTAFHPVGTCAMGVGADAVVDPQLSVHGLSDLRVADASIMPAIVGGNTNAPVMMIADKAADLILGRPALAPVELERIAA